MLWCRNFEETFNSEGEVISVEISEPVVSVNQIVYNECEVPVYWDGESSSLIITDLDFIETINHDSPTCEIVVEICTSFPTCPSANFCETVTFNVLVGMIETGLGLGGIPIYNGNMNENAMTNGSTELEVDGFADLKIYPNPSNGLVNIEMMDGHNQVEIYSVDGKLISKESHLIQGNSIEKTLERGTYIVRVTNENSQETEVKKIIVL